MHLWRLFPASRRDTLWRQRRCALAGSCLLVDSHNAVYSSGDIHRSLDDLHNGRLRQVFRFRSDRAIDYQMPNGGLLTARGSAVVGQDWIWIRLPRFSRRLSPPSTCAAIGDAIRANLATEIIIYPRSMTSTKRMEAKGFGVFCLPSSNRQRGMFY